MRSRVLGILVVLAGLPLWAQVSVEVGSGGLLPTSAGRDVGDGALIHAPRRSVGPAPGRARGDSIWESPNWSGYAVVGSAFTQARGSWVVPAVDKKKARLNTIHHLLSQVAYREVSRETIVLPARMHNPDYTRAPLPEEIIIPQVY